MRVRAPDGALKAQEGQGFRQAEQVREVFVGALLPAARPDELEQRREREQVCGGGGRKEVRYALDRMEGSLDRVAATLVREGAEQRDDTVDVHQQQRLLMVFAGPVLDARGPSVAGICGADGLFSLHTGRDGYSAEDG